MDRFLTVFQNSNRRGVVVQFIEARQMKPGVDVDTLLKFETDIFSSFTRQSHLHFHSEYFSNNQNWKTIVFRMSFMTIKLNFLEQLPVTIC